MYNTGGPIGGHFHPYMYTYFKLLPSGINGLHIHGQLVLAH